MSMNDFLQFLADNLTPILAAITILSFVANVVQYKTNKNIRFILDSIYQTCYRTINVNRARERSGQELIDVIFLIRDQAVSGLRSIGVRKHYGSYDGTSSGEHGLLYSTLRNIYHLLLIIRKKIPNLIQGIDDRDPQITHQIRNNEMRQKGISDYDDGLKH